MKKVVGLILLGLLGIFLVAALPLGAGAEEKPAVSLEQAIRIVKSNFTIPKNYTNFSSSYSSYNQRQVWSLNWDAPELPGGGFRAEVDTTSGEILNLSNWKPVLRPDSGPHLPALPETEARLAAEKFLERLLPGRIKELKLVAGENQVMPLSAPEPYIYSFRWLRVINNVVFPGNSIVIGINGDNGEVVTYNYEWSKVTFPDPNQAVAPAKARENFEKAGMIKSIYTFANSGLETPGKKPEIKLVYQLNHPSNGNIDAQSGEPLKLPVDQWLMDAGNAGRAMEKKHENSAAASTAGGPLSPSEQKEVEKTANTMSQDEALTAVKKWLEIPDDFKLREANLGRYWPAPEIPVWYLGWDSNQNGPQIYKYMNARVNAVSGELIGFDLSPPVEQVKSGDLSRAEAQKIAEDFLQRIQSQRFSEMKVDEQDDFTRGQKLKEGQIPSSHYFNYQRVVNGIPFPNNGISLTVDTKSKTIVSYNLNWSNVDFPVSEGLITPVQATEKFLKYRPLTLTYARLVGPDGPGEARLVYQPQSYSLTAPSFGYLDAKTGEALDWELKPLSGSRQIKALRFNDVKGHYAEKEISLLGQAGVFGDYGEKFRPDDKINATQLLRALLAARNGLWEVKALNDQEIIKRAQDQGWFKENLKPNDPVTRENLAKIMVRFLNLDRAARVEGIFRVPFTDAKNLSPGTKGYVALARGLGLMQGYGSRFVPRQTVTRAEAALVLVRALKVKP